MKVYPISLWLKVRKHRSKCATAFLRMQHSHCVVVDLVVSDAPLVHRQAAKVAFIASSQVLIQRCAAHSRLVRQAYEMGCFKSGGTGS